MNNKIKNKNYKFIKKNWLHKFKGTGKKLKKIKKNILRKNNIIKENLIK
jgi:hypothetical protein